MNLKWVVGLFIVMVIVVSAVTKHYFPTIETKIVEVTKEVVKTDVQTVVKTIRTPDGREETVTTVVDHSQKEINTNKEAIVVKGSTINISALVAKDFSGSTDKPLYGASISKEFIGPVTIGAFGLSNGIIGLSVGINF